MKAVFSNRAYAAILSETVEKIRTETGGVFLGTFEDETYYIIEAVDPGPNSIFEPAYFEYDRKYIQYLAPKLMNLYSEKLSVIGLWHRHPGSFDSFSGTDDITNSQFSVMRPEGAVSALVNIDPFFRITMYHVGPPCVYSRISYETGDEFIPEKFLKLKRHVIINSCSFRTFIKKIITWFAGREINSEVPRAPNSIDKVAEALIDDIFFMTDIAGINIKVIPGDDCIEIMEEGPDKTTKIFFAVSDANGSLFFQHEGVNYSYQAGLFRYLYELNMKGGTL